MTTNYSGSERLTNGTSEYNALEFIIRTIAGRMWTSTLVQVVTVGTDTVDVQPMVHQIDGTGTIVPHGTVHGLPVWQLRGGSGAVIVAPAPGDIGVALFAREDTSVVRKTRAPGAPGSRRRYDAADGVYMGGLWGNPTTTITVGSDGTVKIVAPTSVTIDTPMLNVTGDIQTGPGSTFNGKSFDTHTHGQVQPGSGVSGPPS